MANHKSSKKRIRNSAAKQERNRYQAKTTRNVVKKIRLAKDKTEVKKLLPEGISMLDKLAKKKVLHWKKAANLKSKLAKLANAPK